MFSRETELIGGVCVFKCLLLIIKNWLKLLWRLANSNLLCGLSGSRLKRVDSKISVPKSAGRDADESLV